jgi:hypothetical protein
MTAGVSRSRKNTGLSNKGMKLTSVERTARWQLTPVLDGLSRRCCMLNVRTALLVTVVVSIPRAGMPQTDFDKYMEEIRKAGMSESASGDVRMAAGLLSGSSSFKATRAPDGSVGRSY